MKVTLNEAEEIIKRLRNEDPDIRIDISCDGGLIDYIVCTTLNDLRTKPIK